MKPTSVLVFSIFLFATRSAYSSYQQQTDSLHRLIRLASHDSLRVKYYLYLCDIDNIHFADTALPIANKLLTQAKTPAEKLAFSHYKAEAYRYMAINHERIDKDALKELAFLKLLQKTYQASRDTPHITISYLFIADYYSRNGNAIKQLEVLRKGLDTWEKAHYDRGSATFLNQIASLLADQGDTLLAFDYLERSIRLENKIGDAKRISKSYFETGLFYSRLKDYEKATIYYLKAIRKYTANNDHHPIPEIYLKLGEALQAKRNFEKSSEAYKTGYRLAEIENDNRIKFYLMIAMGSLEEEMGHYEKAIEQHLKNYDIAKRLKGNEVADWLACSALARDYMGLKNYATANFYSDRALVDIKVFGSMEEILETETLVYKIDSLNHDYASAYLHFSEYIRLKTILNGEAIKKIAAREKFLFDLETQKKQALAEQIRRDRLNAKTNENKNTLIYSISIGLLIAVGLAFFIFRGLKQYQKINYELTVKNEIIERQKSLVEEKHREITDSINYAERIQRSFLASKSVLDEHLKDYFVFFQAKDVVSGDFYWAQPLNNNAFALLTADSTGHGVPGAIMSLLNITSVEKAVEQGLTEPAEILNHTRNTIIDRLKKDGSAEGGKDGMDCSFITFNAAKTKLTYSAANNNIWIVRNKVNSENIETSDERELFDLPSNKMPVGKHERDDVSFTQREVDLQKGDMIYTLTDGFSDQFGGPKGKKFMYKHLKKVLITIAHKPTAEQHQILRTTFVNWIGAAEQVDDVTIIGVRV